MAIRTRIKPVGNSDAVTLRREVMTAAGFHRGDEVVIEASKGKVVITRSGSDYARAMEGFRKAAKRYNGVLAALAK